MKKRRVKVIRGHGDIDILLSILRKNKNFSKEEEEKIKYNLYYYLTIYNEFAVDIDDGNIIVAINKENNLVLNFFEYELF